MFALQLKIEYSEFLLKTTDLSVAGIVLECGFNDSSHFATNLKYGSHSVKIQTCVQTKNDWERYNMDLKKLIEQMTLDEKVGQISQFNANVFSGSDD